MAKKAVKKESSKGPVKPKAVSKAQPKVAPKPQSKAQAKSQSQPQAKTQSKAQPKPHSTAQPKPQAKPQSIAQPKPQLKAQPKAPAKGPVTAQRKAPLSAQDKSGQPVAQVMPVVSEDPIEAPKKVAKVTEKPAKKAVDKDLAPKVSAKEKRAEAARVQLAADTDARWADLKDKHGKEKAPKYAMTAQFQANQGIEHPKLGWGFVLSNNNDRLEVIFQDGIKILISNYNSGQKI